MRGFRPFKPYRNRPLCFLDVEGTGTTPGLHEITEIGMHHSVLGGKCIQIAPLHIEIAEPEALRVSRYNSSDWADAPTLVKSAPEIVEYLEDATLIGHNLFGYDVPMLKADLEAKGFDVGHLFRDVIDTMSLARQFLVKLGLNRIGMEACMNFIGEPYNDAHNAYADALFAKKLYEYITENLKWHGRQNGKRIQEQLF